MKLIPINRVAVDELFSHSEGARSWAALHLNDDESFVVDEDCNTITLQAVVTDERTISVKCVDNTSEESNDILEVLSRILALWTISMQPTKDAQTWSVKLFDDQKLELTDINNNDCIQEFFADLDSESEIVEMVTQTSEILGRVPRKLVHRFNLLHRGIGLFVTKDVPITTDREEIASQPHLYCHQRTSTKRIFPSLYDMFVGGVAAAGETSRTTALREVAEELGLNNPSSLSKGKILTCIVCTAYNRCVVDLFTYCMDTKTESVALHQAPASLLPVQFLLHNFQSLSLVP